MREPNIEFVAPGKPPADVLWYAPEKWGRTFMGGDIKSWITVEIIRAPEGYITQGYCIKCGGRIERLLDMRSLGLGPPEIVTPAIMEATKVLLAPANEVVEQWVDGHRQCDVDPVQYEVSDEINAFILTAMRQAGDALRFGNHIPHMLYYLCNDGVMLAFQYYEDDHKYPYNSKESERYRSYDLQVKHFTAREFMRFKGLTPLAVISTVEAWIAMEDSDLDVMPFETYQKRRPSQRADRKEGIGVFVATPTYTYGGTTEIIRTGGQMDKGPGYYGKLDLVHMHFGGRVLAGTTAMTDVPLPAASKRWLTGPPRRTSRRR